MRLLLWVKLKNSLVQMTPVIENDVYECNNTYNGIERNKITYDDSDKDINKIWHRRLAHMNNKYMQRLTRENIVIGIKDRLKDINCEACKTCKLSRRPHRSVIHDQSKEMLDLVYLDLYGPMPVESIGGARYILLIIDDYSNMYFTYFLKNKSDTFHMFQVFKEKCKNMLGGKSIKHIRTDNGTEFINNHFKEMTEREEIEHQKTVPYNPENNGKVERGNRVILERTRTLLFESGLLLKFWAEAIVYVTQHVLQTTPRKNKIKTSFEYCHGRAPNVNYLRTFGCTAFYHINIRNIRNKLQPSGYNGRIFARTYSLSFI